jgi:dTDP-4-dehydrorhamnose reductase
MSDGKGKSSGEKRVLLIGAQGQVGQELVKTLADLPQLGSVVEVSRDILDLTDLSAIATTVADTHPSLIINAAAYTAVDKAESEQALAYRINAEAPRAIAQAAHTCGAALVHISTDYVFAGEAGSPRCETDATGPLGVYGQTKLAGEEAIRDSLEAHIILRTAWVYGTQGKGNFLKTMLRLGKERDSLSVVADQVGSPTWAKDIAETLGQLSVKLGDRPHDPPDVQGQNSPECEASNLFGTYHFTNSGVASWYDFAIAIFEEARNLGIPLKVQTVRPIATADYPTPASRPAYSVLNCQKIARALGYSAPHWRASLRAMMEDYKELV